MRAKMALLLDIQPEELNDPQRLLRRQFELGQQFQAAQQRLVAEFDAAHAQLGKLIQLSILRQPDAQIALGMSLGTTVPLRQIPIADEQSRIANGDSNLDGLDTQRRGLSDSTVTDEKQGESWQAYTERFFRDKPGLADKTVVSFKQAFREWQNLIGNKPLSHLRRTDLKLYADFLRYKPNDRGHTGLLARTTIIRNLGHVKEFLAWSVSSGLVADDNFKIVHARDATKDERLGKKTRRAFTKEELVKFFDCDVFVRQSRYFDTTDYWFFLLGLFTGARVDELARAPAEFVQLGQIKCLDLRDVGTKTTAAPRLVPIHSELTRLGIEDFARRQSKLGYCLLQPGPKARTERQWSKALNARVDRYITDDDTVVFHSFRHTFRQMLRAAGIGDELANKIFGHADGTVGSRYGRDLSVDEAALFMRSVKSPVVLDHLLDLSSFRRGYSNKNRIMN